MTLLEKALSLKRKRVSKNTAPENDEIELFKAHLSGDITWTQLCFALGKKPTKVQCVTYSLMIRCIKSGVLVWK